MAMGLSLVVQPRSAHAAAGIGEICDVDRHVVRDFYWNESLHDLFSRSTGVSVPDVSELAWDDTYIVGKTEAGSWFLIDTRRTGKDAVEIFSLSSPQWQGRLGEIGHSFPRWQYAAKLPRPWWSGARCLVVLLCLLAVVFWPFSLLFVAILGAITVLGARAIRQRNPASRRPCYSPGHDRP